MTDKNNVQNVLIVDDDMQFRVSLNKALTKVGYKVKGAADCTEALNYIREAHFDLVITDQRLPGLSGIELLNEIKKISPDSQVILVTAYGEAALFRRVMEAGAFGYLDKPVKREDILSLVEDALGLTKKHDNTLL